MHKYFTYIILLVFALTLSEFSLSAQEVLRSSRIQARANRKNLPALGVPLRVSGEIDPAVWYKEGLWRGADSLSAPPFWVTETIDVESVVKTSIPSEIVRFCREWVMEKPQGPVHKSTKFHKLEINRIHRSSRRLDAGQISLGLQLQCQLDRMVHRVRSFPETSAGPAGTGRGNDCRRASVLLQRI